jgi:hypothetical protein
MTFPSAEYDQFSEHIDNAGWTYIEIPTSFTLFKGMTPLTTPVSLLDRPTWFSSKAVADLYASELGGSTITFATTRLLRLFVLHNLENLKRLYDLLPSEEERIQLMMMMTGIYNTKEEQWKYFKEQVGEEQLVLHSFNVSDPHRVSVSSKLDKLLAGFIKLYTPFDGYVCKNVPTCIALKQYPLTFLHEEIMLVTQIGTLYHLPQIF